MWTEERGLRRGRGLTSASFSMPHGRTTQKRCSVRTSHSALSLLTLRDVPVPQVCEQDDHDPERRWHSTGGRACRGRAGRGWGGRGWAGRGWAGRRGGWRPGGPPPEGILSPHHSWPRDGDRRVVSDGAPLVLPPDSRAVSTTRPLAEGGSTASRGDGL